MVKQMYRYTRNYVRRIYMIVFREYKKLSVLHRFVGRSTRARACRTDRGGWRRIDRPALQPRRCHAGAYMYTNITCLHSATHPCLTRWWLRGEYRTDCTRPPPSTPPPPTTPDRTHNISV